GVPDASRVELQRTRAHAELVAPVGVREGAELGAGDEDLDAVHRAPGQCSSRQAANGTGALGGDGRDTDTHDDRGPADEGRGNPTKWRRHLHLLGYGDGVSHCGGHESGIDGLPVVRRHSAAASAAPTARLAWRPGRAHVLAAGAPGLPRAGRHLATPPTPEPPPPGGCYPPSPRT